MDAGLFMEGLSQLEVQKGISKAAIIGALKEALRKAYCKSLGGGDDAIVYVTINENPPEISMSHAKKVVSEVQDDYLEISLEDAKAKDPNLNVGDEYVEEVDVDQMSRLTALAVKSVLLQKIKEAEKSALYETHKDKIGEMITGTVEKCDDRGAIVNIGRSNLYLPRKEMIGDETFPAGAPIRLYLADVSNEQKGPQLQITRANPGYIKRVFEEEVREIYDGTVIIKAIAREAGIRSKVAVYSNDPNVDCIGACIGPNGSAIQKILSNLGNAREREKIDIIPWSRNDGLYIVEALRPATVTKIHLDPETKQATVLVPDGQLSLAIGRKGANARVACKLTEWNIDIKEESEEPELGLKFLTIEELQEQEKARLAREKYENYLAQLKASRAEQPQLEAGIQKIKPHQVQDIELEEEAPAAAPAPVAPTISPAAPVPTPAPAAQAAPVQAAPAPAAPAPAPIKPQPKVVRTTTTLASLEKELESEAKKPEFKPQPKSRRPRRITEQEVAREKVEEKEIAKKPRMEIYTKEELAEIEAEEAEKRSREAAEEEEENEYEEFDEYYDEDNR